MNSPPATYRRSQLEEAIARSHHLIGTGGLPATALRSDLKRLLDIDRHPRARKLDSNPERLAFYDDGEAPGHGVEVAYRPYHAFALLIAYRAIEGGMPQSRAVMLLRALRPELEPWFDGLAREPLEELRRDLAGDEAAQRARDGMLFQEPEAMTFLVARAGRGAEAILVPDAGGMEFVTGNVCGFTELKNRLRAFSHLGQAALVVELSNPARQMLALLPLTRLRKRGRH